MHNPLDSSLLKKILISILGVLTTLLVLFFLFRSPLLSNLSRSYILSYEQSHHCNIKFKSIQFSGLQTIDIRELKISQDAKPVFAEVGELKIKIRLWPLLKAKLQTKTIEADRLSLNFITKDRSNNYSFLRKRSKNPEEQPEKDYKEKANRMLDLVFGKIPSKVLITNIKIQIKRDSISSTISIDKLSYSGNQFNTEIKAMQGNSESLFALNGQIDAGNRTLSIKATSNKQGSRIPMLEDYFGLKIMFKSLDFSIDENDMDDEKLVIKGKSEVNGLVLNHWRLASEDVVLDKGAISYKINIGKDAVEIDSTSSVAYNKLQFSPSFKYQNNTSKKISIKIDKQKIDAKDFFESFPTGLFKNLEGIKAKGEIGFHFLFHVDMNQPDSLLYECLLSSKRLAIEHLGNGNLAKMNSEFMYTAYENDQAVKTFAVGSSSPDFVISSAVSDYLKNSILIAEDPEFFRHRGFSTDAFRESIIKNIKEKRFARGGSTLSMQLVKNVFLNRNKNVARKIEEALIVWLIENNHITSKERMFEVYLNIAEWGPRIYGAKAASEFYFAKPPSKLSLAEGIFLAYLIPHPKYFASSFDADGHLKPYMNEYYRLISSKLVKKNWINETDTVHLTPDIQLKGLAKTYLKKQIIEKDSSYFFESDF